MITIAPESCTHAAAHVLADDRISGLPVLGRDGVIASMVSVFDLLAK